MIPKRLLFVFLLATMSISLQAQESVARQWNDVLLHAIRNDFARPTVHARNLFHTSVAMYDCWAVYDTIAQPFFLGKTVGNYTCPFDGIATLPTDIEAARAEALSYAMYRLLIHRFQTSPGGFNTIVSISNKLIELGYDSGVTSTDYSSGDPAALGNYIAEQIIEFGLQDGSKEQQNYNNSFYQPVNPPLVMAFSGNATIEDPNHWQPLTLDVFIDQSGNEIPFNTPPFLSPEWGQVVPFALGPEDRTIYKNPGFDFWVYHDPGMPPQLDTSGVNDNDDYLWGFSLVSIWSSHLDPSDGVTMDISPASLGNIQSYPTNFAEMQDFYRLIEGGDPSIGRPVNPVTGQPYAPNIVPRADYTRVLAEYWADGPDSETPPGHWFTLLNYVNDHPLFEKRYRGEGPILNDLEWDVKAYLMLGGAVHDAAITAWGMKGYYDYLRPISAIRCMADYGQSSDPNLPSYSPGGFPLEPGYIELVEMGDPLAGSNNENVGKVKLYAWKGPDYINNPATDVAGVDWILAENWWPYQRPSFVTPNFAGYVSGHSTFSRAAAEVMTLLTGDEYFPGGMAEFVAPANEFLVFEEGPSVDVTLQWATYRDASDQTSLSRIWGGIHPPADDIPGRLAGIEIGHDAFNYAESFFFRDEDMDGFYHFEDCDDTDAAVNPDQVEICDGKDNDCNGMIDDGLPLFTYYLDTDSDGFGDPMMEVEICVDIPPLNFVTNNLDCNDTDDSISPNGIEVCDGIDNDCNGLIDDGLPSFTYYQDNDNDTYGNLDMPLETCESVPPTGYVANAMDCDDENNMINPDISEVCDGIDNDCNGTIDDALPLYTYYLDNDQDGFGDPALGISICSDNTPMGYVTNGADCDDTTNAINPNAVEICDDIDNDCNGQIDDGLTYYTYYLDNDNDGFGDESNTISSCYLTAPNGYMDNALDCNDQDLSINPAAKELADNGVDEDCTGFDLFEKTNLFPNPVTDELTIRYNYEGTLYLRMFKSDGKLMDEGDIEFVDHFITIDMSQLPIGVYVIIMMDENGERVIMEKVIKR